MHEMALCQGLVDLIEDEARRQGFDRVRRVIVEIGALGHVDPRALAFAFEVTVRGTRANDARLEVREIPGRAWCMACSTVVAVPARGEVCPLCGGSQLIVEGGEEMKLRELEVT
ncbi:MAG: hydrogenase maturation nickel metallochaperone HypA [Pseudomonadales bacterium]|jgi:hydrogenase nickel incorporation protein HypA/HybF|nr:hydrogenase maturation nickel metallochaperone HypA [Pseudomonadales bacterium]